MKNFYLKDQKAYLLLPFIGFIWALSSCSRDVAMPTEPVLPLSLWPNVKVIDTTELELDSAKSAFSNGQFFYNRLKPGNLFRADDIIIGNIGLGYLRKVLAVSQDSQSVILATEQAAISQIFKSGNLTLSLDLNSLFSTQQPGIVWKLQNKVLSNSNNLNLSLQNTEASLEGKWKFDFQFNEKGISKFQFKTDDGVLKSKISVKAFGAQPLLTTRIDTVDFFKKVVTQKVQVGGIEIPFVFNVEPILETKIITDFKNAFDTRLESEVNAGFEMGYHLENGSWQPFFNLSPIISTPVDNLNGNLTSNWNFNFQPTLRIQLFGLDLTNTSLGLIMEEKANIQPNEPNNWGYNAKNWVNANLNFNSKIINNQFLNLNKPWNSSPSTFTKPDSFYVLSGNNQSAISYFYLPNPIEIKVLDSRNNPVKNVPVQFNISEGTGSIDSSIARTDQNGVASTRWKLGNESLQKLAISVTDEKNNSVLSSSAFVEVRANTKLGPCDSLLSFTDLRDGQVYPIVTIGSQVWMAKNLNYNAVGSNCYDNNPANCGIYGRLYDWSTAYSACPSGWHLPSVQEWENMFVATGNIPINSSGKLKSPIGWFPPNTGANNQTCFSALPGGYSYNNLFYLMGNVGFWWTSTIWSPSSSIDISMFYDNQSISTYFKNNLSKESVRCIKD